jgi:hypothetical protein
VSGLINTLSDVATVSLSPQWLQQGLEEQIWLNSTLTRQAWLFVSSTAIAFTICTVSSTFTGLAKSVTLFFTRLISFNFFWWGRQHPCQ